MIKEDLEAGNTFSSSPPSTAHVPESDDIDIDFEEMIFKMVVKVRTACLTFTNVMMNDILGPGDEYNLDELAHDDKGGNILILDVI